MRDINDPYWNDNKGFWKFSLAAIVVAVLANLAILVAIVAAVIYTVHHI